MYQHVKPLVEPLKMRLATDTKARVLRAIHDESNQIKTIAKLVDDTQGKRFEVVACPRGIDMALLVQACKEATAQAVTEELFA